MPSYTQERKSALLNKLLPPNNRPVAEIAQAEGVATTTLYHWLKQHKQQENHMNQSDSSPKPHWTNEAKLAMLLESASLNASELGEYCRRKGLYPQQLEQWKNDCLNGLSSAKQNQQVLDNQLKTAQQHIRELEKDLRRKEKALAESAALLVLQTKFQALWEEKAA